jgi:hypothetical protein
MGTIGLRDKKEEAGRMATALPGVILEVFD